MAVMIERGAVEDKATMVVPGAMTESGAVADRVNSRVAADIGDKDEGGVVVGKKNRSGTKSLAMSLKITNQLT